MLTVAAERSWQRDEEGRLSRPCPDCGGAGVVSASRSVTVELPPGVQDGTRIRLQGPASSGPLYTTVRVRARDR